MKKDVFASTPWKAAVGRTVLLERKMDFMDPVKD